MKDQILELLRREPGYLSGQEMSNRLGVSRAAVWKAVEALRKEGYTIDSAPNRGYRLNAPTGRLSLREISARLEDHPWASLVQVLDCWAGASPPPRGWGCICRSFSARMLHRNG